MPNHLFQFSRLFHRLRSTAVVALSLCLSLLLASGAALAARPRGLARSKLANMPQGWIWPPSPAMLAEGQACLSRLDALGIKYQRAPTTRKVTTPIYLPGMEIGGVALVSIHRKGPHLMDCQLARALAESGAAALRAAGVKALRFSSIYVLRNVAGRRALSRHALGLAMDVYEVVTADGRTLIVKRDHRDPVLLDAERLIIDSGSFRALLTPGNDRRAHRDHFHFEAPLIGG